MIRNAMVIVALAAGTLWAQTATKKPAPARPAAAGVQVDGAALIDETPADNVRLLAVTTGGESLGVTRRRARLADLIHMRQTAQYRFAFAALVHQALAAAERCLSPVEVRLAGG